jgi:hypothetical protein
MRIAGNEIVKNSSTFVVDSLQIRTTFKESRKKLLGLCAFEQHGRSGFITFFQRYSSALE